MEHFEPTFCWTLKKYLKKKSERQKSYLVCSGFYKAWRMARLLSCVQWRVWGIWDNHLRRLGSNLYGLFVGWKKKYSSSIKETDSAKFIVRQIKILFTLPRCLVKPQLFTSRNDITPARANKNPQKGLLHKKEWKKKQLLCRRVVTHATTQKRFFFFSSFIVTVLFPLLKNTVS